MPHNIIWCNVKIDGVIFTNIWRNTIDFRSPDCENTCEHGTLDPQSCSCTCHDGYMGDRCSG